MIRKATTADIERLVLLGRRIHAASASKDLPFDEMRVQLFLATLIARRSGFVLVDERHGEITGVILAGEDEMFFNRQKVGVMYVAFSEYGPSFVRMVRQFVRWAIEDRRCTEVVLDAGFGGAMGQKADEIFERMGFTPHARVFTTRGAL